MKRCGYDQEKSSEQSPAPASQFLVYETEDGQVKIDVRLADETVWLSQHIINICEEGEFLSKATHKKFLSVRREGRRARGSGRRGNRPYTPLQ